MLVGIDQSRSSGADRKGPVVAGPVAVHGVEDVEIGRVAGSQHPIRVDVGVGIGSLTGDGVYPLDMLRAEVVEDLGHQPHALVLAYSRTQRLVELVIGGVHHGAGGREQGDLVLTLDHAGPLHQLLAINHLETLRLKGR